MIIVKVVCSERYYSKKGRAFHGLEQREDMEEVLWFSGALPGRIHGHSEDSTYGADRDGGEFGVGA